MTGAFKTPGCVILSLTVLTPPTSGAVVSVLSDISDFSSCILFLNNKCNHNIEVKEKSRTVLP